MLVQRVVDAGLVGAECAAALQHQHDLLALLFGMVGIRKLGDGRFVHDSPPLMFTEALNARSIRRPPAVPCR